MKNWIAETWNRMLSRRFIAPVLAIVLAGSVGAYEVAKPLVAKAAVAGPTAVPLDDNSIGPLLSLDHAMETLAARVTPAIVKFPSPTLAAIDRSRYCSSMMQKTGRHRGVTAGKGRAASARATCTFTLLPSPLQTTPRVPSLFCRHQIVPARSTVRRGRDCGRACDLS